MSVEDQSLEAGRYEIERKLGEGGAATVYLVRDRETGERLALKRLHRVDERSGARLKRGRANMPGPSARSRQT